MLLVSYPNNLGDGSYSYVGISPKSFIVRTETEVSYVYMGNLNCSKRILCIINVYMLTKVTLLNTSNISLIDVLSDVGGIYALALIIYKFLYGA